MRNKIKNIKISEESHSYLKKFCEQHGLKMFKYIERLIFDNCKITEKFKNDNDIYGD